MTCAKHFPGHGSTPDDSHETLPEVRKSLEDLRREDLIPFRRAIDLDVDMIMMSHVAFPLDGDPYALIDEIHANGTQALPSRDPEPERTFLTITPDGGSGYPEAHCKASPSTHFPDKK